MIRLVLVGAAGRMGRAIALAAGTVPGFAIKARIDQADHIPKDDGGPPWGADLHGSVGPGDVVVEFSSPSAAAEAARVCAEQGAALVSGTTGLSEADETAFASAGRKVAVLRAANFSLGVLALRRALGVALDALPSSWDIEIVERHHRGKADSPSGTALALARQAAERRGYPASALRYGREGGIGPRSDQEIGVHAVRGGSWVGDHAVLLAGPGESLELRHVAQDRSAFAHGVLQAARFVATAKAGLYTLDHIVNAATP